MAALDGNAIAGTLVAVFDTELTTAIGGCGVVERAASWVSSPSIRAAPEQSSGADIVPPW